MNPAVKEYRVVGLDSKIVTFFSNKRTTFREV